MPPALAQLVVPPIRFCRIDVPLFPRVSGEQTFHGSFWGNNADLSEVMALAAEGNGGLVHVEHRSFKARGSSQVPTRHQGPTHTSIRNKQARQLRAALPRATG